MYWDDNDKSIIDGFDSVEVPDYSPLHRSINSFISNDFNYNEQRELTLDTIKILER